MPLVSIVVVTWNSQKVIRDCVESLYAHVPHGEFELLLVDNDSTDKAYLQEYSGRPGTRVIRNSANLGFAKAVNIGLRQAVGDFHLILNPDMIFVSNPFPRLIRELEADRTLGAIGPLLHGTDGLPQIADFYPKLPTVIQFLILRSMFANIPPVRKFALRRFHARVGESGVFPVEQIPGAFLFFRRDLFRGEDALNEAYFIWMEDVDFCMRLKRRGLKVAVVADEKITHIGGTSFKMQAAPWKRMMFTRSYLTYLGLYLPKWKYLFHTGAMAVNAVLIILLFPFTHARKGPVHVANRVALEFKVLGLILSSIPRGLR